MVSQLFFLGGIGEPSPEEMSWILQTEKESLQKKLIDEQYMADRSKAAENEIKSRVLKIEKDFDEETERTSDIISDMTRQYKSKEEDLLSTPFTQLSNFSWNVNFMQNYLFANKIFCSMKVLSSV